MRIAIIIPTRQTRNSEGKTGSSCLPVKQCRVKYEILMLEVGRKVCKKLEAAGQLFKKLEVRNQNVAYLVVQMHHLIFID